MLIKIENRFGVGIDTEVIECDRYEIHVDNEKDGIYLTMYRNGKLKEERSFAHQTEGEGLPKGAQNELNTFGKLLTIYIMNDFGKTIDTIIP